MSADFGRREPADLQSATTSVDGETPAATYDQLAAMARNIGAKPQRPPWRIITWRNIGILALGLITLAIMYYIEHKSIRDNINSIENYSQLTDINGTLDHPIFIHHRRSYSPIFGVLLTNRNEILDFSCDPQRDDLDCIYTEPYDRSSLIGKDTEIKFATVPGRYYEGFVRKIDTDSGTAPIKIPPQPRRIVMEATVNGVTGPQQIYSYQDSLARLKKDSDWLRFTYIDEEWTACAIMAVASCLATYIGARRRRYIQDLFSRTR